MYDFAMFSASGNDAVYQKMLEFSSLLYRDRTQFTNANEVYEWLNGAREEIAAEGGTEVWDTAVREEIYHWAVKELEIYRPNIKLEFWEM